MPIAWSRAIRGATTAVLGGFSLSVAGSMVGLLADPTVCVGLTPTQSWIALHLHVMLPDPSCAQGTFLPTQALAPMLGVTVVVSLSALLAGLVTLLVGLGGGLAVRRLAQRVAGWLRRHWLPVVSGVVPLQRVPAPVRVRVRRTDPRYRAAQRRGPPDHCC